MKKLIIAALVLVSFSAADFAQTGPKNDPSKMQVIKKATDEKKQTQVAAWNKNRERGATFAFRATVVFATGFFVSFFAGLFYTTALLTECMAGFVALFFAGRKKAWPPVQQLST